VVSHVSVSLRCCRGGEVEVVVDVVVVVVLVVACCTWRIC